MPLSNCLMSIWKSFQFDSIMNNGGTVFSPSDLFRLVEGNRSFDVVMKFNEMVVSIFPFPFGSFIANSHEALGRKSTQFIANGRINDKM